MNKWIRVPTALALLALCAAVRAQEKPADVKIVTPIVDKAAGTVTLPGAFWNEHVADWLDVALCGRPSDFLHETVVSVTTTRTLLEQALRDVGCRDGDAWVDGVKDFPRVRGDRFMVVLEFEPGNAGVPPAAGGGGGAGKKEKFSLDELLTFSRWGVSMGPYGFLYKGDPDHAASQPAATAPAGAAGGVTDATKILRDDPQIALVFRGIQSQSQSFADHPLAYVEDRWEWEEMHRGRNHTVLPAAVFDSNGKVAVMVTFKKVTEEELLTESAKVWHDEAFKAYMLKQMDTAKQIDKNKAEYWALRQKVEERAANAGKIKQLLADIEGGYAALDAAWSAWAVEHLKPETDDEPAAIFVKEQAKLWGEFMTLAKERAGQLALAEQMEGAGDKGRALTARSRALLAENKQSRDYWQKQWDKITDPKPDDVWAKSVRLHLALVEARLKVGAAGVTLGQSLDSPLSAAKEAELRQALAAAVSALTLAELRLTLATLEFEISKREGIGAAGGNDAELADLKKQREALLVKIKELSGVP